MARFVDFIIGLSFLALFVAILIGVVTVIMNIPADETDEIITPRFFRPTLAICFFIAALGYPFTIGNGRPILQLAISVPFFAVSFRMFKRPALAWSKVWALVLVVELAQRGLLMFLLPNPAR